MQGRGSWLRKQTTRHQCVAGLDVSSDGVRLVILGGDTNTPNTVYGADKLTFPSAWVQDGVVQSVPDLARWLVQYLQAHDHEVDRWFIGLQDESVRYHLVSLPAGLSPEDVAFQIRHETHLVFPDLEPDFAIDYEVDADPSGGASELTRYFVGVCPKACTESWLEVAHAAGFRFSALEPRRDALARLSQTHLLGQMPAAGVALALQCDAALGLALAGWSKAGYNFFPHRPLWFKALRRAWWMGVAVSAMGGAMLAAGFALVMTASADASLQHLQQAPSAEQALALARKNHQQAQTADRLQTQRAQWLNHRQVTQAQSLAWSQALSQASQGVWVSRIQQQGEHWQVAGEALSSTHAQRLLGHLKSLDIWAKPPELPQLHLGPSSVVGGTSGAGSSVWIFRIEAELKAGG